MQVLSEHLTFDEAKVVVESSNEGKDLYMKGICIQGNVKNANQRVYPTFEINKVSTEKTPAPQNDTGSTDKSPVATK